MAEVKLELQGKPMLVRAAVSDTLPQSVLIGTDVPEMLEMLRRKENMGVEQPSERALVVVTRSCTQSLHKEGVSANAQNTSHKSADSEPDTAVSNNNANPGVVSTFVEEINFDDEVFTQNPTCKPRLTRSKKRQPQQEHAEELFRKRAGMDTPVAQFCELQENDSSLEKFRKGNAKGSCFKQDGLWYHKWTPKPSCGYSVDQLLLPVQCRQKVLQLAHSIPLSGHMGRDRTLQRIQRRFYWPSLFHDVDAYCRTVQIVRK